MQFTKKVLSWKKFFDSILSYFFPPFCLHCRSPLLQEFNLLCSSCCNDLELIDPDQRCPICFNEQEIDVRMKCDSCFKNEKGYDFFAYCFPYQGAAKTLIQNITEKHSQNILEALVPFMFLQLQKLNWPTPDLIMAPPQSFFRTIVSGFNQSKELGYSLAKFLAVPYVNAVRKKQNYCYMNILLEKNNSETSSESFSLKKEIDIVDKNILLIDYVNAKESVLSNCAFEIKTGKPECVYVLTICSSVI